MSDNLRITAPVPNSDGILKPNSGREPVSTDVVEAINPSRVNRPNAQQQNVDSGKMDLLLSRDSVFSKFIQQLRQTPALSETLGKALAGLVRQGGGAVFSLPDDSALRNLMLGMSVKQGDWKTDVLENLAFQLKNSTLFSGPLFQLLGRISGQSGDPQLDLRLAAFLKAFDGFSSVSVTTGAVLANLESVERRMPPPDAKKLAVLVQKLNTENPEASAEPNLQVLKKEIIPFLSSYVSRNSDYGKMRETVSLLLQNVSILNVGTRENLETCFQALLAYCGHSLPEPTLNLARALYAKLTMPSPPEQGQKVQNRMMESLISLLSPGEQSRGEIDPSVRGDICRSLLLDNSVYMPFTHIYLPAVWQGRFLFAQIWVEKRKEEESGSRSAQSELPSRLYLTFDIQDLGYFEAQVELLGKKTDLRLSCPVPLLKQSGEISSALGRILSQNGLKPGEIQLSACDRQEVPDLIFQKILERKQAVDVTV